MREAHVYHGHSIDIDLPKTARSRWTYFIDSRYCIVGTSSSGDVAAARSDVLAQAHRSVEALESMHVTLITPTSTLPSAAAKASPPTMLALVAPIRLRHQEVAPSAASSSVGAPRRRDVEQSGYRPDESWRAVTALTLDTVQP